jgi:hypothetical protein
MKIEMICKSSINLKSVKNFMNKKKWKEYKCNNCGKTFFTKSSTQVNISVCNWHKCNKKTYSFLAFPKPKKILKPLNIAKKISTYFSSIGFNTEASQNIDNRSGKTNLIIAGVQIFDNIIHQGDNIQKNKFFLTQPCVRMQFQSNISLEEDISTSFINICTEQMSLKFSEHMQLVDHWCTILSKIGLHMNNFTIIIRNSKKDWGTGEFSALELFFIYGGLEIGDATYLEIPQSNRPSILISDIGFGLERITWAINKTQLYFDILIPWTEIGKREMFDTCRTLTLLSLCNIKPSNKNSGFQFRKLAKILSEKYYGINLLNILSYYYNYWIQFINPSTTKENAIQSIQLEIERFINLKIRKILKLPSPKNETTDEYINRLVYNHNINIDTLREIIKICKTS